MFVFVYVFGYVPSLCFELPMNIYFKSKYVSFRFYLIYINEKFKDIKGVVNGRKPKDRQYNDQKKGTKIKM